MSKVLYQRNDVFDIAKGIGIMFVLIGHMHHFFSYESTMYTIIYSFHMPLFVLISGAYCSSKSENNNDIIRYIDKRFRDIMMPYYFATILSILCSMPLDRNTMINYLSGILCGNTLNGRMDYNIPLWFLPMIFCANVVFYIIDVIVKKFRYKKVTLVLTTMVLSISGIVLIQRGIYLPWGLEVALMVQLFMCVGKLCKPIVKNSYGKSKSFMILGFALVLSVLIFMNIFRLNGRVDINARNIGNPIWFYVIALVGIAIVLMISVFIRQIPFGLWQIFSFIGKNSMYIMAFHVIVSSFIYGDLLQWMPQLILDNIWKKNVIGIGYCLVSSILVSLLLGKIYKTLFVKREVSKESYE